VSDASENRSGPLAGVKVLDFTWALVGALTTKQLADHGATVIKIESMSRPCMTRFIKQVSASDRKNPNDKPWFSNLNTSKQSFTLNLKQPRAAEVLDRFIDWADVVTENFSPGTMARLGLDYESLREKRADIIMASGSVYGQSGPLAQLPGIDSTGAAVSGRIDLTGWPDRTPAMPGVPYGDVVLPMFMAAAVAAALDYRRRTGRGVHIDASMYEILAQQLVYPLVQSQLACPRPDRQGNRSEYALFQGVFPCTGQDSWIALTLFDRADWRRFTELVGGAWPEAADLSTMSNDAIEDLESKVSKITADWDAQKLMDGLQGVGIAAGVVEDVDEVLADAQLAHRQVLQDIDHRYLGTFGHQVPPYRLSRTPFNMSGAPEIGQQTDEVCRDILGYSETEISELRDAGVFV
jgi:benzylsuccinate CoA-transferase BbsF subunit